MLVTYSYLEPRPYWFPLPYSYLVPCFYWFPGTISAEISQ
jgi:hypothetical protein